MAIAPNCYFEHHQLLNLLIDQTERMNSVITDPALRDRNAKRVVELQAEAAEISKRIKEYDSFTLNNQVKRVSEMAQVCEPTLSVERLVETKGNPRLPMTHGENKQVILSAIVDAQELAAQAIVNANALQLSWERLK